MIDTQAAKYLTAQQYHQLMILINRVHTNNILLYREFKSLMAPVIFQNLIMPGEFKEQDGNSKD